MSYEPLEPPIIPLPSKSTLPARLRSPSEAEAQDILTTFVPSHAQYDEAIFLKLLKGWLENHGLALSYRLKESALKVRRQIRAHPARR